MSQKQSLTRRRFIKKSVGAATAFSMTAAVARAVPGANERINIGAIGVGDQGGNLVKQIAGIKDQLNAQVVALCDVWKVNREAKAKMVEEAFGAKPKTFTRFGDLLAEKDIDAVTIAIPDFAHGPALLAALRADKDVYVEKPMCMTLAETNEALDLTRTRKRVVQTGTMRRSQGIYKTAHEVISSGALGKINRVTSSVNFAGARWLRDYTNCKAEDVDWEAYLLNRPARPFDPKLLRRWHLYKELTLGIAGLWQVHFTDTINMIMGTTYPTSAVTHGGTFIYTENREHCDTYHTLLVYPEGFLFNWSFSLGNTADNPFKFYGLRGTYDVDKCMLSGDGGVKDNQVEDKKYNPQPNTSHMGNWLECIRTRNKPLTDIETGHQHSVAAIMSTAALETGCRQVYDPAKREIHPG